MGLRTVLAKCWRHSYVTIWSRDRNPELWLLLPAALPIRAVTRSGHRTPSGNCPKDVCTKWTASFFAISSKCMWKFYWQMQQHSTAILKRHQKAGTPNGDTRESPHPKINNFLVMRALQLSTVSIFKMIGGPNPKHRVYYLAWAISINK